MTNDSTENLRASVPADLAGQRLDVILHKLIDELPSRSAACKIIDAGLVSVAGKPRRPAFRPDAGDAIEIDARALLPFEGDVRPEAIPLEIAFEDADLLVLNKAAGLVVHPGAGNPGGTLVNAVLHHTGVTLPSLGAPARAGIVHRLDRDTSGVMVVAKSQLALTRLSEDFAAHKQDRNYLALAFGAPATDAGRIATFHGRDPRDRIRYAVLPAGQGKEARLDYCVQARFLEDKASLITCTLHTGRTHQIRVQLAHLGHPLIGDALYTPASRYDASPKPAFQRIRDLASRQMLHASHLAFEHPRTGERLSFDAPLPADFAALLAFLEEPQG